MFCCLRTCLNGNVRKPTAAAHRFREPEIRFDPLNIGSDVILLSNHMRITGNGGALTTAPLVQSKSYFEIKIQQSGCWSVGLATHQADLSKKFGGTDKESWCLCSDNATRHNDEEYRPVVVYTTEPAGGNSSNNKLLNGIDDDALVAATTATATPVTGVGDELKSNSTVIDDATEPAVHHYPDEGDIVGVAFDHVELNFYFNGKNLEVPFRNVRGSVYPVVYVGNGATIDIILDNFQYGPPPGFDRIMLEQSLL